MKNINPKLVAGTAAALMILAGSLNAQSQMSGPGPLASSPKVRAMLHSRPMEVVGIAPSPSAPFGLSLSQPTAASPKVIQMAENNKKYMIAPGAGAVVSSTTRNTDRIAASPKLRERLDERTPGFEIAPLK